MTMADDHIVTADEIVGAHGEPVGSTSAGASAAAARAAKAHQARVLSLTGKATLTDADHRAIDKHASQAIMLNTLSEAYSARSDLAAQSRRELGQTGEARTGGWGGGWSVGSEPTTYRQADHSGPSWVKDMIYVGLRGDPDAAARLHRNTAEVARETRALSTTDGAGGDFVPPLYLVQQYVALARPARVTANLVQNLPLPPGTDSINLPRVLTGTAVAEQATQNTAVQNTDATTGQVTAAVATIAGQQVVSVQMIEQSPVNIDDILLKDLLADLAVKIDLYVLNNNVANKRGLLNVTGINAVTYTSASPTVAGLYSKLADARQQIETGRYLSPTAILMSPRRWAWFLASADTAGRPVVVPTTDGPNNAVGTMNAGPTARAGEVGSIMGLPVFVDPSIPTNLGAGTNQDPVIVFRPEDSILYESLPKAEAFRESKSDQLSVLLRTYSYIAFTGERYARAISVVNGSGTVAPVF